MPVIKPETTGYGMYLIYWPNFRIPINIMKAPVRTKHNNMAGKALSNEPFCAINNAMVVAETTVIGPVGPLICVLVPPNKAANMPNPIAPYRPEAAPKPDCTPKANASGKATIPAVTPPKISPFSD